MKTEGYMPQISILKKQNNDLITYITEILQTWKEYFNTLRTFERLPKEWNEDIIIRIHKKGDLGSTSTASAEELERLNSQPSIIK